jgi:heat shock protein HslJ
MRQGENMLLTKGITPLCTIGLLASVLLAACAPVQAHPEMQASSPLAPAGETTLYVGPTVAACAGLAPQLCLLVTEDPAAEYRNFYDNIEGFTYQPGVAYELAVRKEPVANAPADASSIRWTLIKELGRKPIADLIDLNGTNWQLIAMRDEQDNLVPVPPTAGVTLQFQESRFSGSAGCNRYTGSYRTDFNRLRMAVGSTTRRICPEPQMALEQAYLAALPNTVVHWIVEGNLHLLNAAGNTILILVPASS